MDKHGKKKKRLVKRKTRNSNTKLSKLIGGPAEFIPSEVPTLRDCLRLIVFLQNSKDKFYSLGNIFNEVTEKITQAWANANCLFTSPVTITRKSIFNKLKRAYDFYFDSGRKQKGKKSQWKQQHRSDAKLDGLLDILVCNCKIVLCEEEGAPCNDGCKVI